jgi:hypothetical protein
VGVFTLGGLTTTGLTDVNLSFALLSAATGGSFTVLDLAYSIDGGNSFSLFTVVPIANHTDYNPALTFDVSTLTSGAVNGVSGNKLVFDFVFTGATNSDAATFIDNIQVTAVAVPEPSSYIGALVGILGLCWFQRRRFAQMFASRVKANSVVAV